MGVTLWEAVTQRRCLPNRGTAYLVEAPKSTPYCAMREFVPSVPEALDTLCAVALSHDRNQRFPNAAAFAETIEKAFRADTATPREVGQFVSVVAAAKIRREHDAVREQSAEFTPAEVPVAHTGRRSSLRATPVSVQIVPPPARVPDFGASLTALSEELTLPGAPKSGRGPLDLSDLEPPTAQVSAGRRAAWAHASSAPSLRTLSDAPPPTKRDWASVPLTEDAISEAPPGLDEVLVRGSTAPPPDDSPGALPTPKIPPKTNTEAALPKVENERPAERETLDLATPWPAAPRMPTTFTAPPPPDETRSRVWMVALVALALLAALFAATRH